VPSSMPTGSPPEPDDDRYRSQHVPRFANEEEAERWKRSMLDELRELHQGGHLQPASTPEETPPQGEPFRLIYQRLVPSVLPAERPRLRLVYAKGYEPGQVGPRSKTGDADCSAATSAWKSGRATPETHKQLAKCRAMTKTAKQATLHRAAGNEAKAQALEHRVASKGPLTAKARREEATKRVQERAGMNQARAERQAAASEQARVAAAGEPPPENHEEQARQAAVAAIRAHRARPSPETRVAAETAFAHHQEVSGGKDPFAPERPTPIPGSKPGTIGYEPDAFERDQMEHAARQAEARAQQQPPSLKEQAKAHREARGMNEFARQSMAGQMRGRHEQAMVARLPSAADRVKASFDASGGPRFGMEWIRQHIKASSDHDLEALEKHVSDQPIGSQSRAALGRHLLPEIHTEKRLRREAIQAQSTQPRTIKLRRPSPEHRAAVEATAEAIRARGEISRFAEHGPGAVAVKAEEFRRKRADAQEAIRAARAAEPGSFPPRPYRSPLEGRQPESSEGLMGTAAPAIGPRLSEQTAAHRATKGTPAERIARLREVAKGLTRRDFEAGALDRMNQRTDHLSALDRQITGTPELARRRRKAAPKEIRDLRFEEPTTAQRTGTLKRKKATTEASGLTPHERKVLDVLHAEPKGALTPTGDIKERAGIGHIAADRALLSLAEKGHINLHRHDFPHGMTDAEKRRAVVHGGVHYIGAALRSR
jgi:hypothetical protein